MAAASDDYTDQAMRYVGAAPNLAKAELGVAAVADVGKALWRTGTMAKKSGQDVTSGVMTAEQALKGDVSFAAGEFKHVGKNLFLRTKDIIGSNLADANPGSNDFASSAPVKAKNAAVGVIRGVKMVRKIIAAPKKFLVGAVVVVVVVMLLLFCLSSSNTTSTLIMTTLCAERIEDIQQLVTSINDYRDKTITTELYNAFRGDTDPNGNAYGYHTLTGKRSNNLTHGVTWAYANGISNDTAEIICLAAVYYQQQWPASDLFSSFEGDSVPFFNFCKALAAYGLDVTAQESAPYSCMTYGGCVLGYRSLGETVTITDYKQVTHVCSEGDSECGQYIGSGDTQRWEWSGGHGEDQQHEEWTEDGSHDVTVYFPVVFPDGAGASDLTALPEDAVPIGGAVASSDAVGNLVLSNYNLYKGLSNDWFTEPGALSATFSVVTGDGENAVTDTYEVTFANAEAIPWCPGELHDGQYGHYDLDCTIYMVGYDEYADPETEHPDGSAGGSGNLVPLAHAINDGTLTRTVSKLNQHGTVYASGAAAQYTKTVTLPVSPNFTVWYDGDTDRDGNVAWAEVLYKMDWEDLYQITDGIKCRTVGRGLSDEELADILASLGLDGDSARAQVAAFAIACQGKFSYMMGGKPSGGPGNASAGASLDCSGFIRYCFWSVGLPFQAVNTGDYGSAGDLIPISAAEVQPGDLRVVYSSGGVSGHVQVSIGGGSWIECCSGYGVSINMSNAWMESRPCHYFSYAGF